MNELARVLAPDGIYGSKGVDEATVSFAKIFGASRLDRLVNSFRRNYARVLDLLLSYTSMYLDIEDMRNYNKREKKQTDALLNGLSLTSIALERINYEVEALDNLKFYYKTYISVLPR
jgi:hypothetical protein